MTNKYSLDKIRKSRNEFEALLRIYGISNLRLCKILEVNYLTSKKFPVAMAEKRAMSRVVLKIAGFYEQGVFGQDEIVD